MASLRNSIVRVMRQNKSAIAGTGFVVADEGLVATCSHVVLPCEQQYTADTFPDEILVQFETTGETRTAYVLAWSWCKEHDIAVLKLDGELPNGSNPVKLGYSQSVNGQTFTSFGFPETGEVKGIWANGKIIGCLDSSNLLQLEDNKITKGFSGAPVCAVNDHVVGMIKVIVRRDQYGKLEEVALAVTVEKLYEVCDKLSAAKAQQNPFVPRAGRIRDIDKLFGRDRELEEVFRLLNDDNNVSIVGRPGIGKSSLLEAVFVRASSRLLTPRKQIFVDLGSISSEDDFWELVCLKAGFPNCRGIKLREAMEQRNLLLIIDRVELLSWNVFSPHIRFFLRSMSESGHLRLVTASNLYLDQLFPRDEHQLSPLANLLIPVELVPWDTSTASSFIASRLLGTSVQFSTDEIDEFIKNSAGHPMKLMNLCYERFETHRSS